MHAVEHFRGHSRGHSRGYRGVPVIADDLEGFDAGTIGEGGACRCPVNRGLYGQPQPHRFRLVHLVVPSIRSQPVGLTLSGNQAGSPGNVPKISP